MATVDVSLLSFPFLTDDLTQKHVIKSRVMFIMRGLPGSGKSTIVRHIRDKYQPITDVVVCSADDYFLQEDGSYNYDKEKLGEAHEQCQRKALDACAAGTHVIIIDNTNVRRWEMSHYTQLAFQYSYATVLVTPKTSWRFNAIELAKRNKHCVAVDQIKRKIKSYERILPLYFGWFLNGTDSRDLLERGRHYFKQCQAAFPAFTSVIRENADGIAADEIVFSDYYSRDNSSSETLHCTAFFSNRGRVKSSNEYASQDVVRRSLGRAYTLSVVGFVITGRTMGARVALTPRQTRLWGKDDHEGATSRTHDTAFTVVTDSPGNKKLSKEQQFPAQGTPARRKGRGGGPAKTTTSSSNPFAALAGSDDSDSDSNSNSEAGETGNDVTRDLNSDDDVNSNDDESDVIQSGANLSDNDDPDNHSSEDEDYEEMLSFEMGHVALKDRPRFLPTCGLGSRAHITLGYSKGCTAVQTGLDQIKVIEVEESFYHGNAIAKRPRHVELDDAALIHYGDGQCVVYLNDPVPVTSLFSGRY